MVLGWNMVSYTILCIGLVASLAFVNRAGAQSGIALTSPDVGPSSLEAPIPTFSRSPGDHTVQPGALRQPDRAIGIPHQSPGMSPEPGGNPLWTVPLKDLRFTRDRPLFTPSRRPPTAPATYVEPPKALIPAKPVEPELPRLSLVGVVLGETDGIGIFLDETTKEVVRLRKNEGHDGWVLRRLQGREVTLQKAQSTAVLVIAPPGGARAPATSSPVQELTIQPH
jgi:general secretion pathway protein N